MSDKLREATESFRRWWYNEKIYNVTETPARYCYTQGYQAALKQPKHETVEQWEERTGDTYPDDGPVWMLDTDEYILMRWKYAKDYSCISIVANHHGKPEAIS